MCTEVSPTIYSQYLFTLYLSIPIPCLYNQRTDLTCHLNDISPHAYPSFSLQEVETTISLGLGQTRPSGAKTQPPSPVLAPPEPHQATSESLWICLLGFQTALRPSHYQDLHAFGDPTSGVKPPSSPLKLLHHNKVAVQGGGSDFFH